MMLSLSSEAGGGGLPMVAITRRIMGCMLTGAAAAAASSTCSDFPRSSAPSCVCGAEESPHSDCQRPQWSLSIGSVCLMAQTID